MNTPEEPSIFKLLDDFIVAERIIKGLESKPTNPVFEQKIRASFLQINDLIDLKLHEICDNAPEFTNEEGTSESTSGSL